MNDSKFTRTTKANGENVERIDSSTKNGRENSLFNGLCHFVAVCDFSGFLS
jgi:hypothetical protein